MKIGKKIIDNFEDFVISENLLDGYEDITSVLNWVKIGNYLFKDYKFIRKRLQEIATVNWDNLTENEKFVTAQYKATTEDNCLFILGDEYNYWMADFDIKSITCRAIRFAKAKTVLIKNIDLAGRFAVIGFLNTTKLIENYVQQGIEGTTSGDLISGLYDFVESTGDFISTGLQSFNLVMINNKTKEEMTIDIMNCLKNGDY